MCGIVGFIGEKEAAPILLQGLSSLEYRGYDSAGIAVINSNKINIKKTVKRIVDLKEKSKNDKNLKSSVGIGHTRWATHGIPSEQNAHPHISENFNFAVVHNGIIENYADLRDELINDGIKFKSETDTEVIPHLIKKYYDGNLLNAVIKAKNRLSGSYALGIISALEPDKVIAVKNFSPLIIGVSKIGNFLASDVTAIVPYTKDIIYLEDGQTAVLSKESIEIYNNKLEKEEYKISKIDWDISAAEKGGYEHFMLKEILEQPTVVKNLIETKIRNGRVEFEEISLKNQKLKQIKNIMIVACGSAYNVGIVAKYIFEELLRIPTQVDIASEFRYRNPIIDENTLTIVISQSGETADTLAALKEAKERGSYILSVVNVVGSSIAKASDDVIYTWAGPEIAVATTKGYLSQLVVLYLIAIWMATELETADKSLIKTLLEDILTLPEKIEEILNKKSEIEQKAIKLENPKSLFFMGRNIDYAVSLEASLKLKEISYIHSEAYAAGELKHGTISLIEDGINVVALAYNNQFFDKMMSNIREVKARGANVLAFTQIGNTAIEKEVNDVIYLPKIHSLLSASLEVIPFQLYAYYVARQKGCDIDKPRNLAKSVTVE